MENPSKIAFACGSAPNSVWKSILGAFLSPFYPLGGASRSFWVTLGDPSGSPGRPWAAPGVPWDPLGPPPGLPRDPPGIHLGPSWAPWASWGGSGKVLASENHEKPVNCQARNSRTPNSLVFKILVFKGPAGWAKPK